MPSAGSDARRTPRFHCDAPLANGQSFLLPSAVARHVQVLRLQPGAAITLFTGHGGEFEACIEHMRRSEVQVRINAYHDIEREGPREIHLVVGLPGNERMDWLVEKAVELGASSIQPVMAARSVLKLEGERAERKRAHWRSIAIAACEQCGRNRVPAVGEVLDFDKWLTSLATGGSGPQERWVLSLRPEAKALAVSGQGAAVVLSGPEGGLSPAEESAALAAGFSAATLGPRVLRAETAPLSALSRLA